MKRPLVVYDGDCGFCRRWVERWRSAAGRAADFEPYQTAASRFPAVPREKFQTAVQLFEGGARYEGAEAVFRLLALCGRGGWLWSYRRLPGFAAAAETAYRLVAANRSAFSRLDRLLWGPSERLPTHRAPFSLLLRGLGLVHVAAFGSLWAQAAGLWGSRGVLPIAEYVGAAKAQLGPWGWRYVPSLFWLGAADGALWAACAAGVVLGAALALGLAMGPALLALWALYLSFLSTGREFMSFQWDVLLLETTFLAVWIAPWTAKPRPDWQPPRAGVWLTRLLLLRLMLESGAVKLMSGDPSWRDLSALRHHYESQPLPTWIGWYAHQLPGWAQTASCAAMFAIELLAPLLILLPRRARLAAFYPLVGLQALIALTGNYNFFNLLTVLLCLSLLDDEWFGRWSNSQRPQAVEKPFVRVWARPAFAVLFVLNIFSVSTFLGLPPPAAIRSVLLPLGPFHLVNQYGLFAVMTKDRTEIVLEGSDDGRLWKEYEFKWKPGDPLRRPAFVAPHQPRLDWQMWFAALGTCRENEWLLRLMVRLLEGSPEAAGLLARDPFEGRGPAFIRATRFSYRFTGFGEEGWWRRARLEPYCPAIASRSKAG